MLIKKLSTTQLSEFPEVSQSLRNPNGLLAYSGNLSVAQLMMAYEHGIFPWFNEDQPILWWSPDPRAVIFFSDLKIPRSLKKNLNNKIFSVTIDTAFEEVIYRCAQPHRTQTTTWISKEMQLAYIDLHRAGYAHSVEVWQEKMLIGGLYGVDCGRVFTGESMFNLKPDAAKIALIYLADILKELNYSLIDCQITNPFLLSLGATEIARNQFISILKNGLGVKNTQRWKDISNPRPRIFF